MHMISKGFVAALWVSVSMFGWAIEPAREEGAFVIAVVEDGPCAYFDRLAEATEQELAVLTGKAGAVEWRRDPAWSAGWSVERVPVALDAALNDPEVDAVFAAGVLAAQEAARPERVLSKPVISGSAHDPDTVGLPYDAEGYSTKTNLSFVVIPLRASRDLEALAEMVPFRRLGLAVDALLLEGLDEVDETIRAAEEAGGFTIERLPMGETASEVLAAVDAAMPLDAVYLTPPLRMAGEEWARTIAGLNARRLPTFSMMGRPDVETGALAGLAPDADERMARRLALNLREIAAGAPPESLRVPLAVEERLTLNMATAKAIGWSPGFDLMLRADILGEAPLEEGAPLTLEAAVRRALEANAALAIEGARVRGALQARNLAYSPLLPQIEGNAAGSRIDRNRAESAMGLQPWKQVSAGMRVSQVLLSDPTVSQARAANRLYEGATQQEEAVRLDTIETVANRYIQLLQARALLAIEADNLKLTLSNLELARVRRQVGASGPEELYRWQAQAAAQRATVLRALSDVDTARMALNQTLSEPMTAQWLPEDLEVGTNGYYFLAGRLEPLLNDDRERIALGKHCAELALRQAPELAALDRQIEAQRIQLGQYRRRFVVPELAAEFTYDRVLERAAFDAAGSETDEDQANEWMVGLQATLPLFQGGGRYFQVKQASADLERLLESRRQTEQLIEQRVLSVLASLDSSYPNMQLQHEAAEAANANLEVVRDKYARGGVSILDLLDAQSEAFRANQNAVLAVYAYLQGIFNLQRAMAWFELDRSEAEKDDWIEGYRRRLEAE